MALSTVRYTKKQTSLLTDTGSTTDTRTLHSGAFHTGPVQTGTFHTRIHLEQRKRIHSLSRLRDLFDYVETHERKFESTPDPAPKTTTIKFNPKVSVGSEALEPPSEVEFQLPFPNQNYKPRKPILKNRFLSQCSSLACYDKSDFTDLITNHNTIANSGNVLLRRMQKALAVKIMRRRCLGITDGPSKHKPFDINSSDIVGGKIPSIQNTTEKPALPEFPVAGPGHYPDAALVEHAGKPEHPSGVAERHEALVELLKRAEALEHHKQVHPKPKSRATSSATKANPISFSSPKKLPAPPSKPKTPKTIALVAINGSMRLTEREDTSMIFGPPPSDPSKRTHLMEAWYQYPKIDFDHTDWQALTRYANAMAAQELQFQIPIALHAKKLEEYAKKADEELEKIQNQIDPPEKYKHIRKLGDSVTDPFGVKKYKKLLQENAKSGDGVLNVEMPELFSKIHVDDPSRKKHYPRKNTVKVNEWLETSVLKRLRQPLVWVQQILTKLKKDLEQLPVIKKGFNVVDGRVIYPFYDTTTANTFAKRHTPDKNPLNPLKPVVKRQIPSDKYFATLPVEGFQNKEITLEYMTNTIYITARTLTKYELERGRREYEGSVDIPEDLTISDFEYSRDQHGTLFIEELSDEEKLLENANHLYSHGSRSFRYLFT